MKNYRLHLLLLGLALSILGSCQTPTTKPETDSAQGKTALLYPGEEKHLKNIKQLTFGGQNAEAYFSSDGNWIIFQSQRGGRACDEMYVMKIDGTELRKVSTGKGRVTCGYLLGSNPIKNQPAYTLYASTHADSADCPARPAMATGYAWPIYSTYELYTGSFERPENLTQLTSNKFYDAEATVSGDQRNIVFTSTRDGDLDLYTMTADGKNVKRITNDLGYDGGAFFFHDGKRLIYRAFHPETEEEIKTYKENLKNGFYKPTWLELFYIGVDGKNKTQITHLKGASFAPYMYPSDNRVIFSSNYKDEMRRRFNLFAVNIDGTDLEQITFSDQFDSFPMFSPNGTKLIWASNRNGTVPHETNLFIADWVD